MPKDKILKFVKKYLFENLAVKIICLFSATILWVYLAASQSTIARFPGNIPIIANNTPSGLVAIYDQKSVEIKVMAEPDAWQNLSIDSFSANIDLAGFTEGTFEVPVNVVSKNRGVTIVEKTPAKIIVTLEPLASKEVTVSSRLKGEASLGLVAGKISFNPNEVTIRGAKSIVESISEVYALIELTGEDTDFMRKISLFVDDEKTTGYIEITPNEVMADVAIIKGSNIRTAGIKPNISGKLKDNYQIEKISVNPTVVEITGTYENISTITQIETIKIDISGLESSFEKEVSLVLPSGIALLDSKFQKVLVKIDVVPITTSKDFVVSKFSYQNIDQSKIKSKNFKEISVTLKGPITSINTIDQRLLEATFDFKNFSSFSGSGATFDITSKMLNLPGGVEVTLSDPKTVSFNF